MGLIFGVYDLNFVTPHVIHRSIVDVVYHPKYGNQENDIALIKLEKPVIFNAYVRPLCLPNGKDTDLVLSNVCSVCGYGATEVNGNKYPTVPHCYHAEMGNSFLIRRQVWNFNPLRSIVSAMDTFRYKGVSEGDSGGPLTCKKHFKHFLTGIAYAKHVGAIHRSVSYNFFINVPKFVPWIRKVTKIREKKVVTRNYQSSMI
uniref:Peptidase S1 domain-containing protein n=1 Tax=Romanomermis culicivorax TaxID=13658 RepID=A0A915L429_ROMCU